jgi:hypothetical protein
MVPYWLNSLIGFTTLGLEAALVVALVQLVRESYNRTNVGLKPSVAACLKGRSRTKLISFL